MADFLNDEQRRKLVRVVARRVAERLASESAPKPEPRSRTSSGIIVPCAIPPPGSPRYAAVMGELENTGGGPPSAIRAVLDAGAQRAGAPAGGGTPRECRDLAPFIDHTLLRPDATPREIERLCQEALQWGFASVCVNPAHVALCAGILKGSPVRVCTVVGFPLGATTTSAKAFETREAVANGADEIDMVIAVGRLKARDHAHAFNDIRAVVGAAQGRVVKVILETSRLTDEEKVAGCAIARAAGAHFVKTSTGFADGGATAADVALMRRVVGPNLGVKASGGIRDCVAALEMTAAGADRIGASASVAIVAATRILG